MSLRMTWEPKRSVTKVYICSKLCDVRSSRACMKSALSSGCFLLPDHAGISRTLVEVAVPPSMQVLLCSCHRLYLRYVFLLLLLPHSYGFQECLHHMRPKRTV